MKKCQSSFVRVIISVWNTLECVEISKIKFNDKFMNLILYAIVLFILFDLGKLLDSLSLDSQYFK